MTLAFERPTALVHGTDQDCLKALLTLHASSANPVILDTTFGYGSMWKGMPAQWQPVERLDRRPLPGVTKIGDFRKMPRAWTNKYDVVVFDPPHRTESGKTSLFADRYGLLDESVAHAPDISHLFAPFLRQANRVLRPNGIILAKLIDVVHRGVMHWQIKDFLVAVDNMPGLVACDRQIKDEPKAKNLNNWSAGAVRHNRCDYVYWIVVRKGRC